MEDKKIELEFTDADLEKVRIGNVHIGDDGGEELKSALKDGGITVYPGGLPSSAFTERYARGELPGIEDLESLYAKTRQEMAEKITAEECVKNERIKQEAFILNYTGPIPQNIRYVGKGETKFDATFSDLASLSPTQDYLGARPFRDRSTNPHVQSYLEQTPPPPTVQNLSPQELTTCVSNAIATGLEKAITGVLKSPELSSFIEGLTRSKGILGVMQGLATHSGRNALDARTMDQNALEIFHLMDKAIEATKSRLQEKASGVELDPEIKDAEKEFQEYLARLDNDKGIS